tara:strand:+ start:1117 stop:1587 length:471 start_codon:yes stop_codon:yes gene_type:complete
MNENVINNVSNAVSNTAKKTMKWFVPPANQSANPSVRSGALTPNTGFKPINSTNASGMQQGYLRTKPGGTPTLNKVPPKINNNIKPIKAESVETPIYDAVSEYLIKNDIAQNTDHIHAIMDELDGNEIDFIMNEGKKQKCPDCGKMYTGDTCSCKC